jgi:hypothetical protein
METFLIGAAGGAFASLALSRANQVAARWKSTDAALMAHEAVLDALVTKLGVDVTENKAPHGGQYL